MRTISIACLFTLFLLAACGVPAPGLPRHICLDPLTASALSLTEVCQVTNELFAQRQEYLPQFKIHKV